MKTLLPLLLVGAALVAAPPAVAQDDDGLRWVDAQELLLEGRVFDDTAAPYDRLPARAEAAVRGAVWSLSRHSAGLCVRFVSDAEEIHARWSLTLPELDMWHMPASAVSGLDLYAWDGGGWRWLSVGMPTQQDGNVAQLIRGLDAGEREYLLYLPLYNGTASLEIGVPAGASLEPGPERPAARAKPIVFYGTSITHGACASRAGMPHVAQLGRRLQRPVVNLGFSGNGTMDPEVGALLAEIDAAAYVIDCLPNMRGPAVAERAAPLVRQLRAARPETPILLVEDRTYGYAWLLAAARERSEASRAALAAAHAELLAEGVTDLWYLPADDLLGVDGDATVDGSHPSDLGFVRHADAFEPVLREMLGAR